MAANDLSEDDYYYGVYVPYIERTDPIIEKVQIALGVLSMLMSGSVVFILLYRYKQLVTGKSFVHYILMIAISDTSVAFSWSFGYTSGIACSIQAFISEFFLKMSWFWTVMLVTQLTSFVIRRRLLCNTSVAHFIIWPINIILQFIIFYNGSYYGNYTPGYDNCGFNDELNVLHAIIWDEMEDILLQCSLLVCILCVICVTTYSYYLKMTDPTTAAIVTAVSEAWSTVILYPLSMIVCYLPDQVIGFIGAISVQKTGREPKHYIIVSNSITLLVLLYGMLLSLIFYFKTKEARLEYIKLFRNIFKSNSTKGDNDDLELSRPSSMIDHLEFGRPSSILSIESTTTNIVHTNINRITMTN